MPFTALDEEFRSTARQIQETVVKYLRQKDNVTLVDRSKDSLVIKELFNQMRDVSVAAKNLADQGKLSGAREIITGTLTKVVTEEHYENANSITNSGKKYSAIISFSIQIIDVATGTTTSQVTINSNTSIADGANKLIKGIGAILNKNTEKLETASEVLMADTREKAIQSAIRSCEKHIVKWINKTFLPKISIISINSKKDSIPETLLLAGLNETAKKGSKIIVNEVKMLNTSDGQPLRQVLKTAILKVIEFQGDVALCKLTEGAETIEEKLQNKTIFEFIIK